MITVVMPAYNEADIIEASVREWAAVVVDRIPGSRILVVDDCSTDGTGAVLDRLAVELPWLGVVRPPQNGGHGRATRLGLDTATTEWVFQADSDRQIPVTEFLDLWAVREEADFVVGVRRSRADGPVRVVITNLLRLANLLVWGVWIRDANCPFKLMRLEPMRKVLASIPSDMFIPMVMVSVLARRMGFRVREVPVTHLPRVGGTQSLKGLAKWVRVCRLCAGQLVALRFGRGPETR